MLTNLTTKIQLGLPVEKLDLPNNFLISQEEFSSYRNSEYFEEFAEKSLIAFGKDAHIILVIREPRSWLNSLYVQLCVHESPFQEPEIFFNK